MAAAERFETFSHACTRARRSGSGRLLRAAAARVHGHVGTIPASVAPDLQRGSARGRSKRSRGSVREERARGSHLLLILALLSLGVLLAYSQQQLLDVLVLRQKLFEPVLA
eukprot:855629-Prymnesium_polylepis.1